MNCDPESLSRRPAVRDLLDLELSQPAQSEVGRTRLLCSAHLDDFAVASRRRNRESFRSEAFDMKLHCLAD